MRPFRFGVSEGTARHEHEPGTLTRASWTARARHWEDRGYDILLTADHWDPGGNPPLLPLLLAAEATERLRIGTLVCNNDFHHPAFLARDAATLCLLSEGRFELGLGAGHMRHEYDTLGLVFDQGGTRVDRLAESVAIITRLLRDEEVTYAGAHHTVAGATLGLGSLDVPLLIGGDGRRVLSLAAQHADVVGLCGVAARADGSGVAPGGFTFAAAQQRIGWLREAAGERFADLELNALIQRVIVTHAAERELGELAGRLRVDVDDLRDSPYVLVGSVDAIAERLLVYRERLGITYPVVFSRDAEAFADVIGALS
jgi:probable F420-dependent oxidoreductase